MKRKIISIGLISLILLTGLGTLSVNAYVSGIGTDSKDDVIVVFSDYMKKLNGNNGESIWVSSNPGYSVSVDNNDDNFVALGSCDNKFSFNKFNGNNGKKILGNTFEKDYNYVFQNSMTLDSSDDIVITGLAFDDPFNGPQFRWTIKIDGESGELLNEIIEPNGHGVDADVFVDSEDNIIIFKENGKFIKYDNNLEEELSKGKIDLDMFILTANIDSTDNFIIATYDNFYIEQKKVIIMKFDKYGNKTWNEPVIYDSNYDKDIPRDISVDKQNNIIIVGESKNDNSFKQSFILKYTGGNGSKICIKEEISSCYTYVSTDSSNNIIITGKDTKKYSKEGVLLWTTSKPSNFPPKIPNKPQGPKSVIIGETKTYTTSTTDQDEDQIYYMFDWGDGNKSDWLGPYNSGETCEASHIWENIGTYYIRVKAKDSNELESEYSIKLNVTISEHVKPEANLSLSVYKGILNMGISIFGINAIIENTGDKDATDVFWSISITGGLFGKVNLTKNGNIRKIKSDKSRMISSFSLDSKIKHRFGFINIELEVSIDDKKISKNETGFVLGRIVLIF